MRAFATFLLLLGGLPWLSGCIRKMPERPEGIDYRQEMRQFVIRIGDYARGLRPDFLLVPQNGAELLAAEGGDSSSPAETYLEAINGQAQESLFFGYSADDRPTPAEATQELLSYLQLGQRYGLTILVTDYCSTPEKVDSSYVWNRRLGFVSFAADHRELDDIPAYPHPLPGENARDIRRLGQVSNFLYLINPDNRFSSAEEFVSAVAATNYDLVILDLFFDGQPLSAEQIARLRRKANGGRRLLLGYMSIGQAEDYRYYWKSEWNHKQPDWLDREDPNWPGNYFVKYWEPEWQAIIYGDSTSYTARLIFAGLDGAYLDIIDAFEFFEQTGPAATP
ncbi:MAG TPA: hypothetical protein ENJ23_04750 [Bacteroidetes bacterium]|nr:hypothetical protein [Bacteroidota bacterium]